MAIPLPALATAAPPSLLDTYAKAEELKSLLGQQQIQQQQIQQEQIGTQVARQQWQNQQAMTSAMRDWDGKDLNELPGLVLKNGGSAEAVMNLRSAIIKQQTDLSSLTKDELANKKTQNDYFAQLVDNVKSMPPDQQGAAFDKAKQEAIADGWLSPEQGQSLNYQGPAQLDLLEKSLLGHGAAIATALNQAQQGEDVAKGKQATAAAGVAQAKTMQNDLVTIGQVMGPAANQQQWASRRSFLANKGVDPEMLNLLVPQEFSPQNAQAVRQMAVSPEAMARMPMQNVIAAQWLKDHPGKDLTDFARWYKLMVPVANFNLQMLGVGGSAGPAAQGQSGPAYLGALTPQRRATVLALDEGRMPMPTSFALRTPYWQSVMADLFQYDPRFSVQRAELRQAYTVGPQSKEINAINTALGHVGVLGNAIDALQNGNVQGLNAIANEVGAQTGATPKTTFQTIVHRVAPELMKAYGAVASEGETKITEDDFGPNLSPKQLRANVRMTVDLLRSKIGALENQWDQNAPPTGEKFQQRFIMPQAQKTLQQWGGKATASGLIYARDPSGVLHQAPAGSPLPKGWTPEKNP